MIRAAYSIFALCLAAALPLHGASRIEAWISITNIPNGNTQALTWNSSVTRTWTNSVSDAATQLQTTNSIGASRTNLLTQLAANPLTNGYIVGYGTNTNDIIIYGLTNDFFSIAIGGLWADVRYFTNPIYGSAPVITPFTVQSNAFKNWQMSQLVDMLNSWATNSFSNNAPAFVNFVDTTSSETVSNKTLVFVTIDGTANLRNGSLSNFALTNVTIYSGTVTGSLFTITGNGFGTFATIKSVSSTDALGPAVHFLREDGVTNAVSSGVNIGHLIFGGHGTTLSTLAGARIRGFGQELWTDTSAPAYLTFETSTNGSVSPLERMRVHAGGVLITNGVLRVTTVLYVPQAELTTGFITNLFGGHVTMSTGVLAALTVTTNFIATNAALTRVALHQITTNFGAMISQATTNTSLAVGHNIIDRGSNNVIYFGPSAGVCYIDAITNGFGVGDELEFVNGTGYALVLTNESGVTTIPENRLLTINAVSGVTIATNGWARLRFMGAYNRWLVLYPEPLVGLQPASPFLSNITYNAMPASAALSNAVASGIITNASYGSISETTNTSLSATLSTLGQFYRITTNCIAGRTNGFASSNGTNLVTQVAGVYDIDGYVRGSAFSGDFQVVASIFTNGTQCTLFEGSSLSKTNWHGGIVVNGPPIYLPAFTVIDMRLAATNYIASMPWTNREVRLSARYIAPQ